MSAGGTPSKDPPAPATPLAARQSRWRGQQYADITKLREHAARQDRAATRAQQRVSRLNTKIEKLRHQATLLREKKERTLGEIPEIQQAIKQHQRDIDSATGRGSGSAPTSDVTKLHYNIRKLQQKVVDRQHRAHTLELKAAMRTQKTAELKVRVDRYNEAARIAEQEAGQLRQRADRLQMVSEQDAPAAGAAVSPTPSPGASEGSTQAP